jgi:predicted esterase
MVRRPAGQGAGEPKRLLVALHGHDQTEAQFVDLWNGQFFFEPSFILATIRAPFKAANGYSWFLEGSHPELSAAERRLRSAATDEERVMAAIDSLVEQFGIDEDQVYIAGASQGAGIACHLATEYPDYFAGVALIVGNMDESLREGEKLPDLEEMPVFLAVGTGEGPAIVTSVRKTEQKLVQAGGDVRLFEFPEGHVITAPLIRAMQNHLGLTVDYAPETDEYEPELEDSPQGPGEEEYEKVEGGP